MLDIRTWSLRDNFLTNLNNRRNEINTKFKQISDNLVTRQNQLLTALDGIEKKYLESRNAENLLKQAEKYRDGQNKSLQGSFLTENIIYNIKLIIANLDVQIAELRQKLVTYTNIDIVLDTDSINTLIDKLGSVILTEDGEYNEYVDYKTDMCDIIYLDPCESYTPHNRNINDNNIVCTDALGNKKREQDNSMNNNSPNDNFQDDDNIPKKGIPDSQIQFNLNENVGPIDNNGNPESTAALSNKNTIHNAEADTQVKSLDMCESILFASGIYYAPGAEVAAPDQDVSYYRSKLGFFARFLNLPKFL